MSNKNYGFFLLLCSIGLIISSASGTGYHIPTVAEGLLNDTGCYIGAYLGGNQGANNAMCVNYYRKSNNAPYETQILDHPLEYGEKKTGNSNEELKETDTGIETFRTAIDVLKPGGGKNNFFFPVITICIIIRIMIMEKSHTQNLPLPISGLKKS